ncbi:MAG TPA: HAD-IB family phosphatase [Chloroflexia bacterium]|nr:HAD-IB family phosphatase [Chloroflexia bacterium]
MLILCDFDGTITLKDVTNAFLDDFTGQAWREAVLPQYRAGRINHLQVMQKSYANLKTPLTELIEHTKTIPLRPNFDRLVQLCQARDFPLAIVSGGLDFYIKELLPHDLPFYSYLGEFNEAAQAWEVKMPDWPSVNLHNGEDFKVRVLEELRREYSADLPTVFIGDGRNDGPVASHADYVFAVRGSQLARLCAERGQPFTAFEDFAEVIETLQEKIDGK